MNRSLQAFGCFALCTLLVSCGGGGGGGNSEPASAASPPAPPPVQLLSPTWSLDSATPAELGVTQAEVDQLLSHVFIDQAAQSATLVKDGYVIGERFAPGASADSLGTSWSVAKSFYSAAIGVAIDEGWITSLDQPASEILTEWVGTNKDAVTIQQILEMRAGLPADIDIFFADDQSQFAVNFDKTRPEGVSFEYSNPTSQLFEPLLLRATGLDAHSYLQQKILIPIGVDTNQLGMWFDRTGQNPLTYFGLDMRPVDLARFGLLFARDGEWDGQQIVSPEYVAASLSAQSSFYGFQWWILNSDYFGAATPINVVAALGLDGQKIYVWPEEDIVVVVHTVYGHSANQGYVLSDTNFPDTCTARNSCPDSAVPGFDERALMDLMAALGD